MMRAVPVATAAATEVPFPELTAHAAELDADLTRWPERYGLHKYYTWSYNIRFDSSISSWST